MFQCYESCTYCLLAGQAKQRSCQWRVQSPALTKRFPHQAHSQRVSAPPAPPGGPTTRRPCAPAGQLVRWLAQPARPVQRAVVHERHSSGGARGAFAPGPSLSASTAPHIPRASRRSPTSLRCASSTSARMSEGPSRAASSASVGCALRAARRSSCSASVCRRVRGAEVCTPAFAACSQPSTASQTWTQALKRSSSRWSHHATSTSTVPSVGICRSGQHRSPFHAYSLSHSRRCGG
jgi:hypothetical protein